MGKNKITPTDSKPKRDKFFKKAKPQKVYKQESNLKQRNKSTNNFFVKNVDEDKKVTSIKSNKDKKSDNVKKPFDKKKWRLQKYSKKYKLQQWEDTRKKAILKEYYKQTKEDVPAKIDVQKIYEEAEQEDSNSLRTDMLENENNLNSEVTDDNLTSSQEVPTNKNKRKPHLNAYEEYKKLKEEKRQRKDEIQKKREERDKALKEYKKEKTRKFKKLNQKTSRGQPVMKYRMQMLLEQIQKSTSE